MTKRQHFYHALLGKSVNDSVLAHNEFADSFDVEFWNDAPQALKVFEQENPVNDFFGNSLRSCI